MPLFRYHTFTCNTCVHEWNKPDYHRWFKNYLIYFGTPSECYNCNWQAGQYYQNGAQGTSRSEWVPKKKYNLHGIHSIYHSLLSLIDHEKWWQLWDIRIFYFSLLQRFITIVHVVNDFIGWKATARNKRQTKTNRMLFREYKQNIPVFFLWRSQFMN